MLRFSQPLRVLEESIGIGILATLSLHGCWVWILGYIFMVMIGIGKGME
jgi:hypothetical protein